MIEPPMDLPDNATRTEILYAAICADNFCDWLLLEATIWRERAHELFDQVDDLMEKQKFVMKNGRGLPVREGAQYERSLLTE
jgi:hypothetical protein